RVVAPGTDAEVHGLGEILAVRGGAVVSRMDHDLRWGGRVVGEDVRIRPAHDRDVARPQPYRLTLVGNCPRVPARDGHESERRAVLDAHGPGRLHDHAEQERPARPWPVQETRECIHTLSVDACAWN